MVFVWSSLTKGDPAYTVVQVATNDLIILVAFVPIVNFLLGVSDVSVPWDTLILSVILFVIFPLAGGMLTRYFVTKKKGKVYFENTFVKKFDGITTIGLLLTLIMIFSFQGNVILKNPLQIVLIAVPLILQTFLIFSIAYVACKLLKLPHKTAVPAGIIGASIFFELAVAVAVALFGTTSQISLVAAMAAINNMIRKYGALDAVFGQEQYAQIPMAVVGIVMKFFQIVISIVVGMAAGCIPIVGFNNGAGLNDRVKKLFTKLLIAEACVGAIALIIVEFCPYQLIGIFGASNESAYYTQFAVKAFRIYLCMIIFACINKSAFIFLQAMGKAVASTALSMVREIIFGVGFALILPTFFGLDGVLYSMPVSDILTVIISAVIISVTYRQLSQNPKQIK